MRKDLWAAVLGFLVGAAAIAGGEDDDSLQEELERLQREAARAAQKNWEAEGRPPANDAGLQVAFFPVEDLVLPLRDQIPPSNEFVNEDSEKPVFGGAAEEGFYPNGTIEELMEFIRMSVDPAAWEVATMGQTGWSILTLAPPATNGRVRELLDHKVRPATHRGVAVDLDVVDVPLALARTLRGGAPLTNAQMTAIEEAVRGGTAARRVTLRGAGMLGARFHVWHGRQIALLADADVEVAQTASTADPVIQIAQAGGMLDVRAARVGDSGELKLDLRIRLRELEELRVHESTKTGILDLPVLGDQDAATVLRVPPGAWVVAGAGSPKPGTHRLFLVRAVELARGAVR